MKTIQAPSYKDRIRMKVLVLPSFVPKKQLPINNSNVLRLIHRNGPKTEEPDDLSANINNIRSKIENNRENV